MGRYIFAAVLALVFNSLAVQPVEKSNEHRFTISGDSGVLVGPKWPVGEFNEKGLLIRVDDPTTTGSDSCGFNLFLYGHSGDYACRVGFHAIPLVLHTAYKTLANGQATAVDTSIVITDATTSSAMDGKADMVQISPICCFDYMQARIAPNTRTKKGANLDIRVRLVQINPHAQNN